MEEEILIKLTLSKPENEAEVTRLTKNLLDLKKANADLQKEQKALAKAGQENSAVYIENAKQIAVNNQKVSEATSSRKGLIQTLTAEDNSIKALNVRNAELRKERDLVNTSTLEGRVRISEINAEINKNNKTIIENSSALEKQRFNVGNYKSALEGIVPGLSGFTNGLQGAVTMAKTFIATPIGLVLAAVAAALQFVASYFKNVSDGADFLEDSLTTVSTVFDILIDRVGRFVGGISALLSGDITGGLAKIESSFTGVGDEMEREIGLALELNQAMRDLEDQEIRSSVAAAERNNQIKQLLLQSRDRTKSEAERIKLLEQALELEREGVGEELQNRTEALRIASAQAAQRLNIAKELSESEIEFGKRVLEEFTKDGAVQADDLRDTVKDSLLAITTAEGVSIGIQEKIQNQRDKLADDAEAKALKRAEAKAKREQEEIDRAAKHAKELADLESADEAAELQRFERLRTAEQSIEQTRLEQKIKDAEDLQARVQAEIELEQFKLDTQLTNNVLYQVEKEALIAKSEANITAIKKKGVDEQKKNEDDARIAKEKLDKIATDKETQGRAAASRAAIGFAREAFGNNKAVGVAEVTMNTIQAISRAYKDYAFPYSLIVSVLMGALGAVQIGKIAGVQLAKGGLLKSFGLGGKTGGVLSGPSHAQGGIPFTVGGRPGFEAEGGEAIINRKSTAAYRPLLSAINEAGGGVAFARGGVTQFQTGNVIASTQTASAARAANVLSKSDIGQIAALMNQVQTVLVLEDFETKQGSVDDTRNRATII
jgi:hypothetical protein